MPRLKDDLRNALRALEGRLGELDPENELAAAIRGLRDRMGAIYLAIPGTLPRSQDETEAVLLVMAEARGLVRTP